MENDAGLIDHKHSTSCNKQTAENKKIKNLL
jgi:hypothetical protein